MNIRRTLLFSSLAVAGVAGAAFALFGQQSAPPAAAAASQQVPDAPQATPEATTVPNGPFVVMDTSMGRITCQFYQKQAPKAVANFIGLAEGTKDWTDPTTKKVEHHKPYYDGTIFHRVIPQFMIQGGDPTGTGMGDPGYTFDDEFDPGLNFDRPGRLAMANSGPNTNGSQFFITEQATDFLDQHYTLFGQCDDASVSVVKAIARVERDSNDRPREPVVLKKGGLCVEGSHRRRHHHRRQRRELQPSAHHRRFTFLLERRLVFSFTKPRRSIRSTPKSSCAGHGRPQGSYRHRWHGQGASVVSGPDMLQQAALDAVRQWRYKPYLLNGEPVEVRTTINIIFTLAR
jgi:peptidyl-prolyl cis-trans isomerase A (cyclophilin A)